MIPPPGMTEAGAHSSLNNVIPAPRACASAALGIRRGPVQASMGHEITFCGALPTLVPRAGRKRQRKVFIFNDWPGRIPAVLPARFTRRRGDDAAERITQAHPPHRRKTKKRRARTAHSSSSSPRRAATMPKASQAGTRPSINGARNHFLWGASDSRSSSRPEAPHKK
jgi:hypothetical protein